LLICTACPSANAPLAQQIIACDLGVVSLIAGVT